MLCAMITARRIVGSLSDCTVRIRCILLFQGGRLGCFSILCRQFHSRGEKNNWPNGNRSEDHQCFHIPASRNI